MVAVAVAMADSCRCSGGALVVLWCGERAILREIVLAMYAYNLVYHISVLALLILGPLSLEADLAQAPCHHVKEAHMANLFPKLTPRHHNVDAGK